MGLFGGKKNNLESKDTLDVKSAAIGNNQNNIDLNNMSPPTSNVDTTINSNANNNNFVNPFANQPNLTNTSPENFPKNQNSSPNPFETSNNNNINTNQQTQPLATPQTTQTDISQLNTQNPIDSIVTDNKPQIDFEKIQEMIDETVEKIIEDKWEKLLLSIEKVVNWKEKAETQVNDLKSGISEIKENFESLEKKLSNKISSYDSGLLDVNSEIKALEKVFQKITPTLINNVNELSSIAKSIKESTGVKGIKNLNNKVE